MNLLLGPFHPLLDELILLSRIDKNRCISMLGQDRKDTEQTMIAVCRVHTITHSHT